MNILTFSAAPDQGVQQTVKPRILRAQPGGEGGHATRAADGLNNLDETWQLSWLRRTPAEAAAMLAFFRARGGTEPFAWTSPKGATGLWVCTEWTAVPETAASWTVTAKFERDWNLYEVKTDTTPTWDPSQDWFQVNGSVTSDAAIGYTNGNRTVTNTNTTADTSGMFVAHYRPRKFGRWYYEIRCTRTGNGLEMGWASVGLTTPNSTSGRRSFHVNHAGGAGLYGNVAGTIVSSATVGYDVNDLFRFAVDIEAGKVWIARNGGAWVGGGDPVAGTLPTLSGTLVNGRPAAGGISAGGTIYTQTSFTIYSDTPRLNYSPPAGFTPFGDASDPALDY